MNHSIFSADLMLILSGILAGTGLFLAILGLIKKLPGHRWVALSGMIISFIAALAFAVYLTDLNRTIVTYQQQKTQTTQHYDDSENSINHLTFKFGKYHYSLENPDELYTESSSLKITITNHNKEAVEGTLEFVKSGSNKNLDGYSNYVDFDLKAGESKTYDCLTEETSSKDAKDFSQSTFSVEKKGTYSYFKEEGE